MSKRGNRHWQPSGRQNTGATTPVPSTTTQSVVRHTEVKFRHGPLPSPEEMSAFNDVLPGLADRITRMAEGHATNRWRNDRAARTVAITGQVFAFIVAMTVIIGGLWLVYVGRELSGLAALFTAIGSIIYAIRNIARKKR